MESRTKFKRPNEPARQAVKAKLIAIGIVLGACSCSTRPTPGISGIKPRHDADRPGIEYRVVRIEGREYVATRAKYWPGRGEKWDLVAVNR